MRERIRRLTPEDLDERQRALHDAIAGGPRASGPQHFELADATGALNGPFGLMLHVPDLGAPLQALGSAIRYRTSLSARSREIAVLLCAVECDSDFEWYAHEPIARSVGIGEDELDALRHRRLVPVDPVERAVVHVCRLLLSVAQPSDEDFLALREALGETRLLELSVLVGYYRTLAGMMSLFAVGAPDPTPPG